LTSQDLTFIKFEYLAPIPWRIPVGQILLIVAISFKTANGGGGATKTKIM
jgi:hypothetical protein